jgi:hypothetical protein
MRAQGTVSVAANASSGNVLSGKQIEIPERPSRVSFYAAAAATGVVGTVTAGARTLMEESHISPANRFPQDPEDRMVRDVAMQGQRLNLTFRNSTGAAIIVQWAVDADPVA